MIETGIFGNRAIGRVICDYTCGFNISGQNLIYVRITFERKDEMQDCMEYNK